MKFEQSEEKYIDPGEPVPLLVVNKTSPPFEVCSALSFKKDGRYLVTVKGDKIIVEKFC